MKKISQSPHLFSLVVAVIAAISLMAGMSTARGELLFFDSFEYPAGLLEGQGPPAGAPPGQTGWTQLVGHPVVGVEPLRFPHVYSVGGSVGLKRYSQTVRASLTPVNSGVVWLGYLIRQLRSPTSGYAVINLTASDNTYGFPGYGVLAFFPSLFGIDNDGPGFVQTTIAPAAATTWIVVRIDFDHGTQDMFINPSGPGGTADAHLDMSAEFKSAGFSQVRLNSDATSLYQFDEVRIGTTFEDIRTRR